MHSYFLYLVPPLSSFTNERGGLRGPRRLRRLSRDHLAHLIKHRGFNLVPRVCRRHPPTPRKTTFTSSSMAGAADSRRKKEGKGGGGRTRCMEMRPGRCSSAWRSLTVDTEFRWKISLPLATLPFLIFYFFLSLFFFICFRAALFCGWLLPSERSHPR